MPFIKKADLDELFRAGNQMSNVCFNLGQDSGPLDGVLPLRDRKAMKEGQEHWDKVKQEVKGKIKKR